MNPVSTENKGVIIFNHSSHMLGIFTDTITLTVIKATYNRASVCLMHCSLHCDSVPLSLRLSSCST